MIKEEDIIDMSVFDSGYVLMDGKIGIYLGYEDNDKIKQEILINQKLRQLVEKEIKGMKLLFDETKDHSVGYSLIQFQSLLDEAKK